MPWRDPKHPIWPLARMTVVLVALTATLWLNAEHFDATEIRTIATMFLGLLGIEGIGKAIEAKS